MVSELQFVAVAAFLIWGLAASLCGLVKQDGDDESADLSGHDGASRMKRHSRPS